MPVAWISASWVSLQLLLVIVAKAPGPCNSMTGSASTPVTPTWINDGPIARSNTCFGALPVMMNPPMPTLLPVCTRIRVERLIACVGGVAVGLGLALAVADGLGEGAIVAVAVGVAVGAIDRKRVVEG